MCIFPTVQELALDSAKVIAAMMSMELVVNKTQHQDCLASFRKVCTFMGKRLGMSKEDLPSLLKTKLDECCGSSESLEAYLSSTVMSHQSLLIST